MQENVATKVDKRKYEDKRDRCFQEYWHEKIPWLQHDERGMSTGACYDFPPPSTLKTSLEY